MINFVIRLQPLVRVLVNMIVRISASGLRFENGAPKAAFKHRLLLLLDEFPALGKLDILQDHSPSSLVTGSKATSSVRISISFTLTTAGMKGSHRLATYSARLLQIESRLLST